MEGVEDVSYVRNTADQVVSSKVKPNTLSFEALVLGQELLKGSLLKLQVVILRLLTANIPTVEVIDTRASMPIVECDDNALTFRVARFVLETHGKTNVYAYAELDPPMIVPLGISLVEVTMFKSIPATGLAGCMIVLENCVFSVKEGWPGLEAQGWHRSATKSELPLELLISMVMPFEKQDLFRVGPPRPENAPPLDHVIDSLPTPKPARPGANAMQDKHVPPDTGIKTRRFCRPIFRVRVNRNIRKNVVQGEDAFRCRRYALPDEETLYPPEILTAFAKMTKTAVTEVDEKLWYDTYKEKADERAFYGAMRLKFSAVIDCYRKGIPRPVQSVDLVGQRLFAEHFYRAIGNNIHPALWQAICSPALGERLRDCIPPLAFDVVIEPQYYKSEQNEVNIDYMEHYKAKLELDAGARMDKFMQLPASSLCYVPRLCQHTWRYGIPVSADLVVRRFKAAGIGTGTGNAPYSCNDLYTSGTKTVTKAEIKAANMQASTNKLTDELVCPVAIFNIAYDFTNNPGWVVLDSLESGVEDWIEHIRSGAYVAFALLLCDPKSNNPPFGSPPTTDDERDFRTKTAPPPGCTLETPAEGDAWILSELETLFQGLGEESRTAFKKKLPSPDPAKPLARLPDWKRIWMQDIPNVPYSLPIFAFVAVRRNTRHITPLGLRPLNFSGLKRTAADAAPMPPPDHEKAAAAAAEEEEAASSGSSPKRQRTDDYHSDEYASQ